MKILTFSLLWVGLAAGAVFRSEDGGRSWLRADAGLPAERVNALGEVGGRWLAGTETGIYASNDGGRKWELAGGGAGRILSFATAGANVYAGTDGGLLWSTDGGRQFTPVLAFPAKRVRSLAVLGETVYAGTDRDGVLASENAGRSWQRLNSGWPALGQAFALAVSGGRVFAGLYAKGLWVWEAGRWQKRGETTPLALAAVGETLVAGHNPGGLRRSADGGRNWQETMPTVPVWEMGAGGGRVVAGAGEGVFVSDDEGRTWRRAALPQQTPGISMVVRGETMLVGVLLRRGAVAGE
jgi:photosystem II stability/assembly factor-like uncharacterized protein